MDHYFYLGVFFLFVCGIFFWGGGLPLIFCLQNNIPVFHLTKVNMPLPPPPQQTSDDPPILFKFKLTYCSKLTILINGIKVGIKLMFGAFLIHFNIYMTEL